MCKYNRSEQNPEQHSAYILCNLIFSGDHREFGVSDVIKWMAECRRFSKSADCLLFILGSFCLQTSSAYCNRAYIIRRSKAHCDTLIPLAAAARPMVSFCSEFMRKSRRASRWPVAMALLSYVRLNTVHTATLHTHGSNGSSM